jgi:hypothetical protein
LYSVECVPQPHHAGQSSHLAVLSPILRPHAYLCLPRSRPPDVYHTAAVVTAVVVAAMAASGGRRCKMQRPEPEPEPEPEQMSIPQIIQPPESSLSLFFKG